jgi:tRNA-specific 2-thiouridylase
MNLSRRFFKMRFKVITSKIGSVNLSIECPASNLIFLERQEAMSKKTVMVAMSGGVDSSVAAALLKEQGHEVIGITMDLFPLPKQECEGFRSCCGRGAIADANRVAAQLKIPHYVINLRKSFQKWVTDNFCEEYALGKTPNPCIRCNQFIKFDILWERAKKMGAEYLATGHHANIFFDEASGRFILSKGKDPKKDQSYFLYTMTQDQLARTMMPIGQLTKANVRKLARELDLAVHKRPESQEICFIPDDDYARFLSQKIPESFQSGPIVDTDGHVLGYHKGILHFTIGQRRGLGIAASHPLYVLEIHPENRKIVVGYNEQLFQKNIVVGQLNLIARPSLTYPVSVMAKIRYKHDEAKALLSPMEKNRARLDFETPQRAVTPGQSAVFYDKDLVLGGGIIERM